MKNPKTVAGLLVLSALVIMIAIFGSRVLRLVPEVQIERSLTPTPDPVYGNVLVITPDPSQPTSVPVLKKGSSGEYVKTLQARLLELGYAIGEIDGDFGSATENALITFQAQNDLTPDGVAGSATYALLFSERARPYVQATVQITPEPVATPSPSPIPEATKGYEIQGMPILVNKENLLPEDYQPYDLVVLNTYCPSEVVHIKYSDTLAEREAADALLDMLRAGIAAGESNWQISAAYRTVAQQQQLFDRQVRKYMNENNLSRSKAVSATRKTVADPGTSEHHLGLAFDITIPGKSFGSTEQAKWLAENCWDYGFILRYTKEKQDITGFLAEPWHFRYVGTEHSRIMRDEDLCLEEYLSLYANLSFEDET